MKLVTFLSTLLVPCIVVGSLVPGALPDSEIAAGGASNLLIRSGCTANVCNSSQVYTLCFSRILYAISYLGLHEP
jgi:hypothetical protein